MKIHEYREMMKYLTRPKDKLSKEEKKKIVKDFHKKAEQPKPMPITDYIQKMNFLYGNGEDPKEIDPREFEDIKKSLPVSEMVKKPKNKKEKKGWRYTSWADGQKDIEEMKIKDNKKKKTFIKKEIKVVEKPKPTIQEQLNFEDYLNTLDPLWLEDEEEPKPKVLVREPRRTAQGIQTILNLHKKKNT